MPDAEALTKKFASGFDPCVQEQLDALNGVIAAAREWRAARTVCLADGKITREQYDRLARAEGALSDAVRLLER